ncbi:MAG TPA: CheR family methyltransferase [Leptospiraceae bacterium]|nr:CheR family methyltransferase [Leptospiraceae bacterium]HMW05604.1 CheR family methyltransferase [Leptospiraceae bacterium]HMX34375.1 CheR family methyltransferase [Leptospiraceae bacterium]HMY31113.1 CheR family methyltransferase [Leptospiraceae bacterium]HMZ63696.1 CheR family methyltransferase [Leptospiraceae bacterium]
MNIPPLLDKEFKYFQKLIFELAGLNMTIAKKPLIGNRLATRLRYYELDSYLEYYEIVADSRNKSERQIFVDLLTTNETSFFREPIHFDFMKSQILPKLETQNPFRVWSAACSSGEEPYSIAMLLDEFIKNNSKWEIIASDISSRVLEKSKKGLYPIDKSNMIPERYLKQYCLKGVNSNEGYFKISDYIRNKIEFKSVNLNEHFPKDLGKFNLVFLRNVMIYFDKPTRINLIRKISEILQPGGYLFIGHSETLLEITDALMMVRPTIYKKK